jgi:voltage-gated potassium channel
LRARIYNRLRYSDPSPAARRWRAMHLTVLGIGLLAVVLLSIDELPREIKHWLRVVIWSVTVVFFLEYVVRLWVAPEITRFDQQSPTMARARWAISAPGLIGLLAVLPAAMLAGGYGITGSDTASVFCILWVLKLGLQHRPSARSPGSCPTNARRSPAC